MAFYLFYYNKIVRNTALISSLFLTSSIFAVSPDPTCPEGNSSKSPLQKLSTDVAKASSKLSSAEKCVEKLTPSEVQEIQTIDQEITSLNSSDPNQYQESVRKIIQKHQKKISPAIRQYLLANKAAQTILEMQKVKKEHPEINKSFNQYTNALSKFVDEMKKSGFDKEKIKAAKNNFKKEQDELLEVIDKENISSSEFKKNLKKGVYQTAHVAFQALGDELEHSMRNTALALFAVDSVQYTLELFVAHAGVGFASTSLGASVIGGVGAGGFMGALTNVKILSHAAVSSTPESSFFCRLAEEVLADPKAAQTAERQGWLTGAALGGGLGVLGKFSQTSAALAGMGSTVAFAGMGVASTLEAGSDCAKLILESENLPSVSKDEWKKVCTDTAINGLATALSIPALKTMTKNITGSVNKNQLLKMGEVIKNGMNNLVAFEKSLVQKIATLASQLNGANSQVTEKLTKGMKAEAMKLPPEKQQKIIDLSLLAANAMKSGMYGTPNGKERFIDIVTGIASKYKNIHLGGKNGDVVLDRLLKLEKANPNAKTSEIVEKYLDLYTPQGIGKIVTRNSMQPLTDAQTLARAKDVLGHDLSQAQQDALLKAHHLFDLKTVIGKDGKNTAGINNLTEKQLEEVAHVLNPAFKDPLEVRALVESGTSGKWLDSVIAKVSNKTTERIKGPQEIKKYKDLGYSAKKLRDMGASVKDLYEADFFSSKKDLEAIIKLKDVAPRAGKSWDGDRMLGVYILKKLGYTAKELKDVGIDAYQLQLADYDVKNEINPIFSLKELRKQTKLSAENYKELGYSAKELRKTGFSMNDLYKAGFFSSRQDLEALVRLKDVAPRAAMASDNQDFLGVFVLKKLGYTAKELKDVGIDAYQLQLADYDVKNEINPIFTLKELKKQTFLSVLDYKYLGYSAKELKGVSVGINALYDAGYIKSRQDLEALASLKEVAPQRGDKAGIVGVYILKNLGYTAKELKDVGINAYQLQLAGFDSKNDLKPIFTLKELKKQTFLKVRDLLKMGFTVEEIKAAGYTKEEIALGLRKPDPEEEKWEADKKRDYKNAWH